MIKYEAFLVPVCFILTIVPSCVCWKFFENLSELALEDPMPYDEKPTVIEYYYGDCKDPYKVLYSTTQFHEGITKDYLIIRGWLDVPKMPTCTVLRAKSAIAEDVYRPSSYSFNVCVLRITYCHTQNTFEYFYFEWYIPPDYVDARIQHDLLFYGPPDSKLSPTNFKVDAVEPAGYVVTRKDNITSK